MALTFIIETNIGFYEELTLAQIRALRRHAARKYLTYIARTPSGDYAIRKTRHLKHNIRQRARWAKRYQSEYKLTDRDRFKYFGF